MNTKDRNIEFFECDCHDRDHLLRASYEVWPEKKRMSYGEIALEFRTKISDNNYTSPAHSQLYNFYIKCKMRLLWMTQILFTGKIDSEGWFVPCRIIDSMEYSIENLFGYEETKNLAKWLDTKADLLKSEFDSDLAKYSKKIE